MDLRLIETLVHRDRSKSVHEALAEFGAVDVWRYQLDGDRVSVKALLPSGSVEEAVDRLERLIGPNGEGRIVLTSVQATIPRMDEPEEEAVAGGNGEDKPERRFGTGRVSREELFTQVDGATHPTRTYFVLVILSAIVAAIGLLRDNTAIVIGAMVIAPLLGPNVALALGTTLADLPLARRAARVAVSGLLVALALSIVIGLLFEVDLSSRELSSRTNVGVGEIILALASGAAGAIAFTTGAPSALIGVMVAVALLPPTVALGMLTGSGMWSDARNAGMLLLVNLAAVNLAAVSTFLIQGIRPATWWEARAARRATRVALVLWATVLAVLTVVIWLARPVVQAEIP